MINMRPNDLEPFEGIRADMRFPFGLALGLALDLDLGFGLGFFFFTADLKSEVRIDSPDIA